MCICVYYVYMYVCTYVYRYICIYAYIFATPILPRSVQSSAGIRGKYHSILVVASCQITLEDCLSDVRRGAALYPFGLLSERPKGALTYDPEAADQL